jgi:hypothetical protein
MADANIVLRRIQKQGAIYYMTLNSVSLYEFTDAPILLRPIPQQNYGLRII